MTVQFHADDLGLHPAVDRAIFRAFEAGAMPAPRSWSPGRRFRGRPDRPGRLACRQACISPVVDTAPLSPTAEIPSLVGPDGRFPPFFGAVVRRALLGERLGGLRRSDLRLEIGRQLQAFADAGLSGERGLQVDGHQHLHLLRPSSTLCYTRVPGFRWRPPAAAPLAPQRRQGGARSLGFVVAELLGRRAARLAARQGIAAVPCWGVLYAGH